MPLTSTEFVIGPCLITVDGVEIGFTSDDGVSLSTDMKTVEMEPNQVIGVVDAHRYGVKCNASFKMFQVTLDKFALLADLVAPSSGGTLNVAWNSNVSKRSLVITGPGVNGGTRVITGVAGVMKIGKQDLSNKSYLNLDVEMMYFADENGTHYTITETAGSSAVPAPASYQYINGGVETAFVDASTTVPDDSTYVQMTFNVAIRPDQLSASHFILKTQTGNAQAAATYTYGTTDSAVDYKKVRVKPTGGFASTTAYDFAVVAGTRSADNVPSILTAVQFTTTA